MIKSLILAFALAVAGCASTGNTTPEQTVFGAKSTYAAALTAAVAYKKLPACAATAPPPCSSPAIVAQLQKADNVASSALDAAETAVRTPQIGTTATDRAVSAASAALAAFTALLATLGATP